MAASTNDWAGAVYIWAPWVNSRFEFWFLKPRTWRSALRRRQLFNDFCQSSRGDTRQLHNWSYHEASTTAARKLYQQGNHHQRAILTGAAYSTAAYRSIANTPLAGCPHCHTATTTSTHMAPPLLDLPNSQQPTTTTTNSLHSSTGMATA